MSDFISTKQKILFISICGICAAIVFVATSIHIPTPGAIGYIHLGDAVILSFIYMYGLLNKSLNSKVRIKFLILLALAGGVGSAIADLVAGFPIYICGTFIIKFLIGLISIKSSSFKRRVPLFILSECIMILGYFLYESLPFVFGIKVAVMEIGFNIIQGTASVWVAWLVTGFFARRQCNTKQCEKTKDK